MHDKHTESAAGQGSQAVRSMLDSSLCKMHYDLGTDQAPWSVAHFSGVSFDGVDLYDDQGIGGRKVLRNREDIDINPVDQFLLAMPRTARASLAQNGRVNNCAPGNAIIFSTAMPFSSAIIAERPGGHYSQLLGRISGAMLRQRLPHVDLLSNYLFSTEAGAGKVVKSLFELGVSDGALFSPQQSRHFGEMLVDAIANVMREATMPGMALATEDMSSRVRIRRMALSYIERNLSNPGLNVEHVAAHCGVSERYLHLAFADVSLKLGAHIREARLQRCREALHDPTLRGRSVIEIALQWGYEDSGHFSRAYKARFGKPPREDRMSHDRTESPD